MPSGPERKRTSALGFESWTNSNSWHLLGSDRLPGTTNRVTCILSFEPPNPEGECYGCPFITDEEVKGQRRVHHDEVCWSWDFHTVRF